MSVIMFMRLQNNNEGYFAGIRKDILLNITWNNKKKKFSSKLRPRRSSKKDFVAVEIRSCRNPRG